MKTILIHEKDTELLSAWASYLAQNDLAVFTSSDAVEAAEIASVVKVDSVVISSSDPASYILLGGAVRQRKAPVKLVVISQLDQSMLRFLLMTEDFVKMECPFRFGALEEIVKCINQKQRVTENAIA